MAPPSPPMNGTNGDTGASPPPPPKTGGPQAYQDAIKKFQISEMVQEKYPEMIALVVETESMQDDERQYWFSILPIMTDEQVAKLREILLNEKEQLKKLDDEYAKELRKVNEEQLTKYQEIEAKEKWSKIRGAEAKSEEQEKAEEEGILKKLQEL